MAAMSPSSSSSSSSRTSCLPYLSGESSPLPSPLGFVQQPRTAPQPPPGAAHTRNISEASAASSVSAYSTATTTSFTDDVFVDATSSYPPSPANSAASFAGRQQPSQASEAPAFTPKPLMLRRTGPSALRQQARNSRARLSSAPTSLPGTPQQSVNASPSKEGIVRLDIDALLDESSPALLLDHLQVALHRSPPMLGEEFPPPQQQQQQQADLDLTPTPPQPACFESNTNMDHHSSDEDVSAELPSLPQRQLPPVGSLPPRPSKPLPPLPLRHSHKRQISRDSATGVLSTPKAAGSSSSSPRTPPSKPPVSASGRRYMRSDSVTNSEASTDSSAYYSSDPSTAPTSPASSPRSVGSASSHKYYRSSPRMRSNSDFSLLSSLAGKNNNSSSEVMLRSSSEGSAKTFASHSSSSSGSGSSMAGSERSWEQDFTSSVWTKSQTFGSPTSSSFAPSASSSSASSSASSVAAANGLPAPSLLFGGAGGASRPAPGFSTSQTTAKAKASLDYEEEQAGSTFEDDDTKSTSKGSSASSAKSMKSKRSIGNLGKWFRRKPSLGDLKASPKSHHHEPMPTRSALDVERR